MKRAPPFQTPGFLGVGRFIPTSPPPRLRRPEAERAGGARLPTPGPGTSSAVSHAKARCDSEDTSSSNFNGGDWKETEGVRRHRADGGVRPPAASP